MANIPKSILKELNLPVSFSPDGKKVTLKEYVTTKRDSSLSLCHLKPSQLAEIIVTRITEKPEIKLSMVGSQDVIGKERAIAEVKAQSAIGQIIMEAQRYEIENIIEEIETDYLEDIIVDYV